MNISDLTVGDIVDAYINGEETHRVMIIEIGETLVFGIDSDNEEYSIEPRSEIERVIANINEL